ncbi:MAG TPA: hypothetical protein VI522_04410 [Gammaproteobacteria bacterium]|nr:hypothetical protein [Gammaproteobacteria bacterium]
MLNKYKVSLLALVAMFSFSSFAQDSVPGFYVEVELGNYLVDPPVEPVSVTIELCPVKPAMTCVVQPFFTGIPVFVPFEGEGMVYLKKIEINTGYGIGMDTRVINFKTPFKNCTVDPSTRVYSSVDGKGYPILEISFGNNVFETELNCETEIFWASPVN